MRLRSSILAMVFTLAAVISCSVVQADDQWFRIRSSCIAIALAWHLEALPPDPTNRVADDPRAAELGQRLFSDTRLSSNGKVSCASCHLPDKDFQDGIALGKGVGTSNRRTMPVAGSAYSRFLFWDGRKDSQWAQALGPLENPVEHGGNRAQYAHVIAEHYRNEYENIFGPLPDLAAIPRNAGPVADPVAAANWNILQANSQEVVTEIFVNIGKTIAAYERRIQFAPSRFDDYVAALVADDVSKRSILTADEMAGARLFIGKANCTQCHNGPLLSNQEFHNTGLPARIGLPQDRGRIIGAAGVLADEFNCRSRWSDLEPERCDELAYMVTASPELERAYKVPTLRNVARRAPYMHAGQFATLADVLAHYNKAPAAPAGHTEIRPLKLGAKEIRQLEAFLHTLDSVIDAPVISATNNISQLQEAAF